ncbi:MAG: AF1514 family protein [Thermodesulfobacteriota bacterium]
MTEIRIAITGMALDFDTARIVAKALALRDNPDTMLVAWGDRHRDTHSPCCVKCAIGDRPGWEVYGENHEGRLRIAFNDEAYVFIHS